MNTTFNFGQGPVPAHRHRNGEGWVADTAFVESTVYVGPDARVYGDAQLYGDAQVYGHAQVFGEAWVYNNAAVYGHAQVYGAAEVHGDAQVYGHARVHGHAWIYGNAKVCGYVRIGGATKVHGETQIDGASIDPHPQHDTQEQVTMINTYTGHSSEHPGLQQHSIGPNYPGIIYGVEFEGNPTLYWGLLYRGFDWGTFATYEQAQGTLGLLKAVRAVLARPVNLMMAEQRDTDLRTARRALARFLDVNRLARPGIMVPVGRTRDLPCPGDARESVTREGIGYTDRPGMPVDDMFAPIRWRLQYEATPGCDKLLAHWGYDPAIF
jgi:hypothetical protein